MMDIINAAYVEVVHKDSTYILSVNMATALTLSFTISEWEHIFLHWGQTT